MNSPYKEELLQVLPLIIFNTNPEFGRTCLSCYRILEQGIIEATSSPSRQNIIPEQITLIFLRHYTNIDTSNIKLGPENF
jgi:hypothetical protein